MAKKKKRSYPSLNELLEKPFCYYCEREFEDLRVLMSHQKAKHFKCEKCGRRLNTAGGLAVHMNQVHKETLEQVDNALPNRSDLNVEIFGMEGVPADIVEQHKRRVIEDYYSKAHEHLRKTGNVPRGVDLERPNKMPKMETREELRKRFDEWRAQKKAGRDPNADGAANGVHENHNISQNQAGSPPNANQQAFAPPGFSQPGQYLQQPPMGFAPNGQQLPPGMQPYPQLGISGSPSGFAPPSASPPLGYDQRPPPSQDPRLRGASAADSSDPRRAERASANASSLDDLIASAAAKESEPAAAAAPEKKSKKDKDKASVMVFATADASLEEAMARLGPYAFDRAKEPEDTVLGDAVQATSVGAAVGDGPLNDE